MHLLSKEISDIIHVNKTKDRTFDVVEKLKQSTGNDQMCGCNVVSLKHFEDNPELAAKFNEISKSSLENSYVAVETQGDTTYYSPSLPNPVGTLPYTIKVIFHSLHGGSSSAWSEGDCQYLIDAFNVKYSGGGTIPSRWANVAGDLGIRLQFEKLNLVPYSGQSFCNDSTCYYGPENAVPPENPEYFMNVWIASLPSGFAGWASLAGIMDTSYACTIASALTLGPARNTFEHEVGHLLGLWHIWGPTSAAFFEGDGHSCDDDDLVADTPIQFGPTNEGGAGACDTSIDSCLNNPGQDMWENIMDYSHAYCSSGWTYETSFLTLGQGDKMRAAIEAAPHVDKLLGFTPATTTTTTTTTTVAPTTKLSWPVPAGHTSLNFYDPSWTGDSGDTYPTHKGMDVGFHGSVPAGAGTAYWANVVANPITVYAAAGGTIIEIVDGYDDQCMSCNQTTSTFGEHDPGGNLCSDVTGGAFSPPCGNYVIIDHGPNTGLGYRYTDYAHLAKNSTNHLTKGQAIGKWDPIAVVGSSGNSCGPHLHFQVATELFNSGIPLADGCGGTSLQTTSATCVDPFLSTAFLGGSNVSESLWVDQCSLPIYNTNTASGNVPPLLSSCSTTTTTTAAPTTTTTAAPTTTTAAPTTTTAAPTTTTVAPTTTTTPAPTTTTPAPPSQAEGLIWPINDMGEPQQGIISFFDTNWYGNSNHGYSGHTGTDIGHYGANDRPHPNSEVIAAAWGKVLRINDGEPDECNGYNYNTSECGGGCAGGNCGGNWVVIDHDPNGTLGLIAAFGYRYTEYSHMQNGISVQVNQIVTKGQKIGLVGSSGGGTGGITTPHLHFEVGVSAGSGPFVSGPIDPFYSEGGQGSNTTKSAWADQCAIQVICHNWDTFPEDCTGQGGCPVPPLCTTATTTTAGGGGDEDGSSCNPPIPNWVQGQSYAIGDRVCRDFCGSAHEEFLGVTTRGVYRCIQYVSGSTPLADPCQGIGWGYWVRDTSYDHCCSWATTTTAAPTTTTAAPTTTTAAPTTTTAAPTTTTAAPTTTPEPPVVGTTPSLPLCPADATCLLGGGSDSGGGVINIYECVKAKGVEIQRVYTSEGALLKTIINTTLEIFFVEEISGDVIERWINDVNAFSQIGEPIPLLTIGPVTFTNCRVTKLMFPTAPSAMESAVQRGSYSMLVEEVANGDIFNYAGLTGDMLENVSEEISYSVTANSQYSVNHTVSVTPNERMGTSTLNPSLVAKAVLDSWTPVNEGSMLHSSFHNVLRSAGVVGDLSSSVNKITGQASWTRSIETLDNVFLSGAGATSYPSTFEFVHNLVFDKDGIITVTENGKLKLLKTADSYSGSAPDEDISYLGAELPDLITDSFARANLVFANYVDRPIASGRVLDVSIPAVVEALRSSPAETVRTVNGVSQELAWSVTYTNDPRFETDGKLIDRDVAISQASTGIVTINEKNSVIFPGTRKTPDGGAAPNGANWYLADSALSSSRVNGYWTNTWDSHLNPLAVNLFIFTEVRRSISYNPAGKNFSYNVIHVSDKNLPSPGTVAHDIGIIKLETKTSDKLPQKIIREFPIPGLTMLVHNPQQSNLGSRTVSFTAYLNRNVFQQLGPPPYETQTLPLAIAVRNYLALLARAELLNVFIEYPGLIFDNIFVTDCTWSINSQRTITLNATVQYVQAV